MRPHALALSRFAGGLALVLALVLAACSLRRDPPPGANGQEIYAYQNCHNCHGRLGEGSSLGPPLRNLAQIWKLDDLTDYLADPRGWIERVPRLKKLDEHFSGNMGSYANLDREQRRVLAAWLLEL